MPRSDLPFGSESLMARSISRCSSSWRTGMDQTGRPSSKPCAIATSRTTALWKGNRITFVASDGVSAQFQYDIRLDEMVAVGADGAMRTEGSAQVDTATASPIWRAVRTHTSCSDAVSGSVGKRRNPFGSAL